VLVPLLSPHKDKIVFNVSWFQLFEPNACYKSCFHDPYTSKRDLRDWLQVTDVDMNIRQSEFLAIMSELS
jgi:hypothetical protein